MKYLFASHAITRKWVMALLYLIVIVIVLAVPAASTACPTCSGRPAAVWSYQPHRSTLGSTFDDAATDSLANAPDYDQIWRGVCPDCYLVTVSTSEPIPSVILKAVGWQESSWRQFDCDYPGIDDTWDNTLISSGCDYGIMQMHDCMWNGCGWFTPDSVARYIDYNVGTGTNWLIGEKWNKLDFYIGGNNHTYPEDWYYAVMWYGPGGWSNSNNPNNGDYSPQRPPYREGDYGNYVYPYQEYIWGHMAHPPWVGQSLWQSERIPWIPRGIFGPDSPDDWQPARETPRPIFYYLPDIKVNSDNWNSYIVLQNTSDDLTLAVDIALYNQDGTFDRWRLDPPINDPPPYIRLDPHTSRTLSVADSFDWWESFNGSAVIAASEDVLVTVENRNAEDNTAYAYDGVAPSGGVGNAGFGTAGTPVYLPIMMRGHYGWHTSMTIQNTGSAPTNVTVTYYSQGGGVEDTETITNLVPNASATRDQSQNPNLPADYLGHAEVTSSSGQPLAVVVQQQHSNGFWATYNGFSDGAATLYIPSVRDNYYGWKTGLAVQNLESNGANVRVSYYKPDGAGPWNSTRWIPGHGSGYFYTPAEPLPPDYTTGTAVVRCLYCNNKLAAVVIATYPFDSAQKGMSYDASPSGTPDLYAPLVISNDSTQDWVSSVTVQNIGASSTTATIRYFDEDGTERASRSENIDVNGHEVFYVPADVGVNGWKGSAWVTAGRDIVAIVNGVNYSSEPPVSEDRAWSYNGFNR